MKQEIDNLDIFYYLQCVKKHENSKMALMSREEKVSYIVSQLTAIEKYLPNMVVYCKQDNIKDLIETDDEEEKCYGK